MAAGKTGINRSCEGQERMNGVSTCQDQRLLRHSCGPALAATDAISV